jgi:hypothetical protein
LCASRQCGEAGIYTTVRDEADRIAVMTQHADLPQ